MPPTAPRLTRRTDPLVKRFREVARRADTDRAVVLLDGVHLVLEALRADLPVEAILASADLLQGEGAELRQLWSLARASGAAIYDASPDVIAAASPVRTPSGLVALARWMPAAIEEVWGPAPALAVGVVDVQDPGNAGAVIRCADGLDATGVVMMGAAADPAGWKALRGAMGSTFRIPVARAATLTTIEAARGAGIQVVATVAPGDPRAIELREADLRRPTLLLLGNEGAGLPPVAVEAADVRVFVAMRPGLDSFNVSVTAGLLLYEARRQRA